MENNQDHLHKAFHDNRLLVKVPQVTAFFWIIKILQVWVRPPLGALASASLCSFEPV